MLDGGGIERYSSLLGIVVLLGLAVLLSENRRRIKLRSVVGAFAIQAAVAMLVFYLATGKEVLAAISSGVQSVVDYGNVGIEFVFGDLAKHKLGFIVVVNVLPVIIFFSSLMAVLYYLGIMPQVVRVLGGVLSRILGTSRTESVTASANVFVGLTEAPLVVRPYIMGLTQSELFAVMVGGLASTAGSMLAGYAALGIKVEYLVAASFMAAPGGLLMAKIIRPEVDQPSDGATTETEFDQTDHPSNVIDAAASGAVGGLKLAGNVGAMLIAFIALIALLNGFIGFIGGFFGLPDLSMQQIMGYAFSPLAFLLGVSWEESGAVGSLLGEKLIINEFVAFVSLLDFQDALSERAQIITTFALCGFANLGSLAILLGGLGGMAPGRRHDIALMGVKAVAAGILANLMSAALAGFFLTLA